MGALKKSRVRASGLQDRRGTTATRLSPGHEGRALRADPPALAVSRTVGTRDQNRCECAVLRKRRTHRRYLRDEFRHYLSSRLFFAQWSRASNYSCQRRSRAKRSVLEAGTFVCVIPFRDPREVLRPARRRISAASCR